MLLIKTVDFIILYIDYNIMHGNIFITHIKIYN